MQGSVNIGYCVGGFGGWLLDDCTIVTTIFLPKASRSREHGHQGLPSIRTLGNFDTPVLTHHHHHSTFISCTHVKFQPLVGVGIAWIRCQAVGVVLSTIGHGSYIPGKRGVHTLSGTVQSIATITKLQLRNTTAAFLLVEFQFCFHKHAHRIPSSSKA